MNKIILSTSLSLLCTVSACLALNTDEQLSFAGSFYMANESLRQSTEFVDSKLLGASGMSAGLSSSDYDLDDDSDRNFYGDFDTTVASVAYIYALDSVNLGVFGSFVSGNLEAEPTNGATSLETEADGWTLGFGVSKQWDKLSLSAKASYGILSIDTERDTGPVLGTKDSDYDATMMNLEILAIYELLENDTYALSPFLKLGYTALENDDIAEPVAAIDDVAIESFDDDTPYAEIGLHVDYKGFESIFPYASIAVWQDLGDDEVELEGLTNGILFNQRDVPDVEQTVFKLKLGADYLVNEDLALGASVGYLAGDSIDGVNAAFEASWAF